MKKIKTYKQYEKNISNEITDEMLEEFVKKYEKQYIEFFSDMFNSFRETLIETIKEHDIKNYELNSYNFIKTLNSDMNECRYIIEGGLSTYDVEDCMKNDSILYKKYADDVDKYNECIYDIIVNDNLECLESLKQKELEKDIEDNPERWKELKDFIYDYRIYNKFKHLDNAKNFDLI